MLDKGMIKRGFLRERIVPDFLINDSLFTTFERFMSDSTGYWNF